MGRITGRRARIYVGIASDTAQAEPLPFQASWSINFPTNKIDVTTFDDDNFTYLADLPNVAGEFSGFYDDATSQTYQAAIDGLPRKFYLYPKRDTATQYWFGTIVVDFNVNSTVSGATQVSASWAPASKIQKVG